jgi:isoleucyl-tRNA synthetase
VFEDVWYELPSLADDQKFMDDWHEIRNFRELVNKRLEEKRELGEIGSSLAATVKIYADNPVYDALLRLGGDLRFVLITSHAEVVYREGAPQVEVQASTHAKCERCWHYRADVGLHPAHPTICDRCVSNLFGEGEPRQYA